VPYAGRKPFTGPRAIAHAACEVSAAEEEREQKQLEEVIEELEEVTQHFLNRFFVYVRPVGAHGAPLSSMELNYLQLF